MPALQQIDVPAAWRASRGHGVTVAVLDTGVDATAPDLAGQVTTGPDYAAGADPAGYKLPLSHGTYIASLIAGHGRGRATPWASSASPRRRGSSRSGSSRTTPSRDSPPITRKPRYADAIGEGIRYAVDNHAKVINMSLSAQRPTAYLRASIAYAIARGVVVVASAGNGGTGSAFAPYLYPASFPGVIAVAAVTSAGARASFSQQNSSVVVAAPGVDVVAAPTGSTSPGTAPARPPPWSAASPR